MWLLFPLHAQGEDSPQNTTILVPAFDATLSLDWFDTAVFFAHRYFVPNETVLEFVCTFIQNNARVVMVIAPSALALNQKTDEKPSAAPKAPVPSNYKGVVARAGSVQPEDEAEPVAIITSEDETNTPAVKSNVDTAVVDTPVPAVLDAVLVGENRVTLNRVSSESKLIAADAQTPDAPGDAQKQVGMEAVLVEDVIKAVQEDMIVAKTTPEETVTTAETNMVKAPRLIDVNDYAPDNSTPTTTGTLELSYEERIMNSPIFTRNNARLINLEDYIKDPLSFDASRASTHKLSSQTVLVTRNPLLTIEGTTAGVAPEAVVQERFAPDRFIVKFKSNWPHGLERCAQQIHTQGLEFKDYLFDGSSSIDQLNKICRVKTVKGMFMDRHQYSAQEAKAVQENMMQKVKKAFPARTQRMNSNPQMPDLFDTYIFEVPDDSDIQKICALYEQDPHVDFAQPDYRHKPAVFPTTPPNDPLYAFVQWALNNTGQTGGTIDADIDAPEAWMNNLGDSIVVAVVDTGVDYNHLDLAANIWINDGEDINTNGVIDGTNTCPVANGDFNCVDDDGNGFVDDLRGYDFGNSDNNPFDFDGHGTAAAGVIGAITDNATGVASAAPKAKIMPVKGFSDVGLGFSSDLADGIVYAAMNGADVINNSWGCLDPCPSDPVAEAAVTVAHGLGAVVVFSAGNDALDVADFSPQNMQPETITVAATDQDDKRAGFSNTGTLLDVSAPGVDIATTFPGNNYFFVDGTSFSSPYTAAVAALILSEHPTMTNDQVRIILRDSSDDIDVVGFDANTGMGRINADQSLSLINVLPRLDPIGDKTATTGIVFEFDVFGFDPKGDMMTLDAEIAGGGALATIGAMFTDNGDGTGTFSWTPAHPGQAGLDPDITFTLTDSPGGFTDTETISITVNLGAGVCGDTVLDPGEECDDGNITEGDGCSKTCDLEVCGDGDLDFGETCDDNNVISGDGCTDMCAVEFCSDGTVNNNGMEECDDGNVVSGDGCSSICTDEICGNGIMDVGEQCDDGNTANGDGCDSTCMREDTSCGNGFLDGAEECDDGNTISGDGCTSACIDEFCGDDTVNDGGVEECDDGNTFDGDLCSSVCLDEVCGNGITDVAIGESCDDGNTISGDGCSSSCQVEILAVCGNGICEIDRFETCASCRVDCGYCRGLRPR